MPLSERKKVHYVVVCVNLFARKKGLSVQEAFQYLYRYEGISFLDACYDAEHTLSLDDAIEDLTIVCRNNGGQIA